MIENLSRLAMLDWPLLPAEKLADSRACFDAGIAWLQHNSHLAKPDLGYSPRRG